MIPRSPPNTIATYISEYITTANHKKQTEGNTAILSIDDATRQYPWAELPFTWYHRLTGDGYTGWEAENIVGMTLKAMRESGLPAGLLKNTWHNDFVVDDSLIERAQQIFKNIKEKYDGRMAGLKTYFSLENGGLTRFKELSAGLKRPIMRTFNMNEYEAEDVVEEVLLTVFERLVFTFQDAIFNDKDFTNSFYKGLLTTTFNHAKHYLRAQVNQRSWREGYYLKWLKEQLDKEGTGNCFVHSFPAAIEYCISQESSELLEEAISRLPPRQQRTLRMKLDGATYNEISERRNTSEFSERMMVCRAKKNVKKNLRKKGLKKSDFF